MKMKMKRKIMLWIWKWLTKQLIDTKWMDRQMQSLKIEERYFMTGIQLGMLLAYMEDCIER